MQGIVSEGHWSVTESVEYDVLVFREFLCFISTAVIGCCVPLASLEFVLFSTGGSVNVACFRDRVCITVEAVRAV